MLRYEPGLAGWAFFVSPLCLSKPNGAGRIAVIQGTQELMNLSSEGLLARIVKPCTITEVVEEE